MKTKRLLPTARQVLPWLAAGMLGTMPALSAPQSEVRLSFKFILNASGYRPPTGNINTDAEIEDQVALGNQIYRHYISEFRHLEVEILDVAGQSAYYLNTATSADRDEIRNAALANKAAFHWRDNAINIYITGANGSAISKFPPDNDIILLCQGVYDTTMAHEVGHSLNLYHTHETAGSDGGDECSDTLHDDDAWTSRDQMAQYAYGLNYNQLNAAQKAAVDRTWDNLMSYHDPDSRSVLTGCQMDRESTQAYSDRNWLLSGIPVYVRAGASGPGSGSWASPYPTIQAAISGGLNNRVLVLMTGTHADPTSTLATDTDIVTRRGISYCREKEPAYRLPYNVEDSTNTAVRDAVVRAQKFDKQGNATNALAAFKQAAAAASGREREALQLEIAQRLSAMERYPEAEQYFATVAQEADQPALRAKCQKKANVMKAKEEQRIQKLQKKSNDDTQPGKKQP